MAEGRREPHKRFKYFVYEAINALPMKIKAFVAYAHEDSGLKKRLINHLTVPAIQEVLEVWHDGEIKPGRE